jgi:flagellar biosynthesis protein FlhB
MEDPLLEEKLITEISYPLFHSRSWIKLIGIVGIVYGLFMAISIVGIVFAWLPIWIGVLLFQAGNKISAAYNAGDKMSLIKVQKNLANCFTIYGVIVLVSLIFGLVIVLFVIYYGLPDNVEEIQKYIQNDFY